MYVRVLTDEQIGKIHQASLRILENVGVVVPHEEMLGRFADSSAKVDFKEKRVWIPSDLVMKSIAIAEKRFTIYGRDITKTARFGYNTRNYNGTAGQASWLDNIGGERRPATLKDVIDATRICDALSDINVVGAMADPHELSVDYRCVEVAATMIKNTTKPLTFWFYDRTTAKYLVDMLIAVRGSQKKAEEYPMFYPFFEPISPLRFPFHGIDLIFETSKIKLPVPVGPMAQMGLSAPGTIAGTLAQQNAEILAGICITQLIQPGLPVCYGGTCHAFDMATTQLIFSGPEQAILSVAMTEMGKYYGFPVYINVGLTDSKRPDAQAGLEAGVTLAFGAAAGADIFGHMGICGVDQASSLDILVLQNEIISFIESSMREVDFSDESLGIDEISEVGPGGTFIDRIHTAEHFRQELWFPKLLDRNYYQQWLENGATSLEERCRKQREELLKTHKPEPISDELAKQLDEIVAEAKAKTKG
jgi:trimethylamine--corrinoid protein Co-methyltransferase